MKDQETNADKTKNDDKQEQTEQVEERLTDAITDLLKKTMEKKTMVTVTSSQEKTKPQPKETAKRKIATVTSSPPQTKDIPTKKDTNITTIVINGKACTQRSLDFSEDKPKSKIPTSKVRVGRPPGNPGHKQKSGPRQRSRSRHRDSGSGEGRSNLS